MFVSVSLVQAHCLVTRVSVGFGDGCHIIIIIIEKVLKERVRNERIGIFV